MLFICRILALAIALACFGGAATVLIVVASRAGAKTSFIACPENEHDAGEVAQGQIVSAKFRVSNCGPHRVRLYQFSKSCSCTSAIISRELLSPQDVVDISVNWDTADERGAQKSGVILAADDLETGEMCFIEISLRASIIPHYDIVPQRLVLSPTAHSSVRIVTRDKSVVSIVGVEASSSIDPLSTRIEGDSLVVEWPSSDSLKEGYIKITTNSTRQRYAFVEVRKISQSSK